MSCDEIQTGNPGGVSSPRAQCAGPSPEESVDYPLMLGDLTPVKRQSNPASLLACLSGAPAFLLGTACLSAVGGPHWLAWADNPLACGASGLAGVTACLLGIGSLCGR